MGGTSFLNLDFSLISQGPNSGDAFWQSDHSWTIIAGAGATNPGFTTFATVSNGFASGTFSSLAGPNGGASLHFAANVPEPCAGALMALGGLLLLSQTRRRSP